MADIDQAAYKSYRAFAVRIGSNPVTFDAWQKNRFSKAQPMRGNAEELANRERRIERRRRMAPLPEPAEISKTS